MGLGQGQIVMEKTESGRNRQIVAKNGKKWQLDVS